MQPLEVHTHSFVSGPRSRSAYGRSFSHSHPGGNTQHSHPLTGPAVYTIDKDDWARATLLRGGGRKKFTNKPSGEQFDLTPYGSRIAQLEASR